MVTTLHQLEELLRSLEPDTLRELAYQAAHSHVLVCELTSRSGGCVHIGADEVRDRLEDLTIGQLAALLAPNAWMSIDLHQRLGG